MRLWARRSMFRGSIGVLQTHLLGLGHGWLWAIGLAVTVFEVGLGMCMQRSPLCGSEFVSRSTRFGSTAGIQGRQLDRMAA